MKRIKIILLLMFLILLPVKTMALSVDSDLISVNKRGVNIELGDLLLKNVTFVSYNNYQNTKTKGYIVNASFYSAYDKEVEVKIILKLYDSSKNILRTYEDNYKLLKDKIALFEVGEQYPAVDGIAYYSIYLEMLTDVSKPEKKELSSAYYIDNFNANIDITEKREVKYNNKIDVNFESSNYFFNYYIPVKDIYVLRDINVNNVYKLDLEKGINNLRIGSKDKKMNKNEYYNITYTYDMGKDYNKGKDIVEFDIVNSFSNYVKKGDFIINVPDSKRINNIYFYLDGKEERIKYDLNNNSIKGSFDTIKSNSVLSAKIEFEDKYFMKASSIIDIWMMLGLFLPIACLLIILLIFILVRDKKIIAKKLDLDLLKKYSSLEVGFLYNDKLDDKDIMSMLISLANKGYINIERNSDGFVLKKIKEYQEENEFEKDFLDGIFYNNKIVNEEDLYYMDSSFIDDIKYNINYKYKNRFYNNYFNKYSLFIIICYISLFIISYRPLINYDESFLVLGVSLSLIIFTVIFVVVNSNFKVIERVIGYLCILVFYSFLFYFIILPSLNISSLYLFIYFIGLLCLSGILAIYRLIPKRKRATNKLLRIINRLKKNIEKNKNIPEESFLELLPYTYAIDCYDKYTNTNTCEKVDWYEDENFVYLDFVRDIKTLLANITYDLTHNIGNGVNK